MYPYFRLFRILINAKFGSSLSLDDDSVLKMRVFVGDIDIYPEAEELRPWDNEIKNK